MDSLLMVMNTGEARLTASSMDLEKQFDCAKGGSWEFKDHLIEDYQTYLTY